MQINSYGLYGNNDNFAFLTLLKKHYHICECMFIANNIMGVN